MFTILVSECSLTTYLEGFLMRVAVVGASGRTGRATVAHAVAAGHDVVAVVRTASSAPDGAATAVADARDVAALTSALKGCDAVVSCLGHVPGANDPAILGEGAAALRKAMTAATVSRVIAISAAGAYVQDDDPLSRYLAKPLVARYFGATFDDTRAMEAAFASSAARWTMLRPSRLIPGESAKPYRAGIDRAVWWHYNTRFDTVGRAAVDALTTDAWVEHAVFITG
jgi:putative NADH-flavin reductase